MSNFLHVFVQLFTSVSLPYAVLVLVELHPIDFVFFQITARSDPVPYHWEPHLQSLKLL